MTEEVLDIMHRQTVIGQKILAGFKDDIVQILDISEINRIYAVDKSESLPRYGLLFGSFHIMSGDIKSAKSMKN